MSSLQWIEEDPENEDREHDWYAQGTPYTCVSDGVLMFAYIDGVCLGGYDDAEEAKAACQAHVDTEEWLDYRLADVLRGRRASPLRLLLEERFGLIRTEEELDPMLQVWERLLMEAGRAARRPLPKT